MKKSQALGIRFGPAAVKLQFSYFANTKEYQGDASLAEVLIVPFDPFQLRASKSGNPQSNLG